MTKQSDILKGLKEHGIAPPTGAKEKVFRRLGTLTNPFSPLRPPLENLAPDMPQLGFLQEDTVVSPREAFDSIMRKIKPEQKKGNRIFFYSGAAAACLLLALTIMGVYRMGRKGASSAGSYRLKTVPVLPRQDGKPATDAGHLAGNVQAQKGPAGIDSTNIPGDNTAANKQATANADDFFRSTRVRVDGQAFPLVENDLLITLTSFKYNEIPGFLTRDDVDTKVQADQYAAITISPEMYKMMKKMYNYRSNGIPTRRARKERERLAGWKKADESRFDGSAPKNPLNPIDLAGFIFK